MAKPLSAFYPFVLPYCVGVPETLVDQMLWDAADEFCRVSEVLRERADAIPVIAGIAELDVEAADRFAVPYRVVDAMLTVGNRTVALDPVRPERQGETERRTPWSFWQPTADVLRLYPVPDQAGSLQLTVVTRPKQGATELDDRLYNEWRSGVVAGTIARIKLVPNTPTHDPQTASVFQGVFQTEADKAYSQGQQWRSRSRLRVRAVR